MEFGLNVWSQVTKVKSQILDFESRYLSMWKVASV